METDFAVIGGGIAGASVAYHLGERTEGSVTVFERERSIGTGKTAASNAVFRTSGPERLRGMKAYGLSLYNYFLSEPASNADEESFYERLDRLEVATSDDADATLAERAAETTGRYLDAREIREAVMVPELRSDAVHGALWYPDAIRFEPRTLVNEFVTRAREAGVSFETGTTVTNVRTDDTGVIGLATDDDLVRTSAVVSTAGACNARIAAWAGVDLPQRHDVGVLRTVRPDTPLGYTFPNLKHADTGVFYTGRADGAIVVGDSGGGYDVSERRDPDTAPATVPSTIAERIDATAEAIVPALSGGNVRTVHEWIGYACKTPDGYPIVGLTNVDGFAVVAFDSEGIQLAPAAGRIVAEQLADSRPPSEYPDVSPGRFEASR